LKAALDNSIILALVQSTAVIFTSKDLTSTESIAISIFSPAFGV